MFSKLVFPESLVIYFINLDFSENSDLRLILKFLGEHSLNKNGDEFSLECMMFFQIISPGTLSIKIA